MITFAALGAFEAAGDFETAGAFVAGFTAGFAPLRGAAMAGAETTTPNIAPIASNRINSIPRDP